MSEAERWIRESGYRKIVLSSRVGVEKFYEKLGYGYNARTRPTAAPSDASTWKRN
jgi:histone acetyltransferase (RNA polymerase elongator complex component)